MNERKNTRRVYCSDLRRQQQEATRSRIMEAVAAIVARDGLSFSVQDVAAQAGVSYASVYRHFPTREALLEALYETGTKIIGSSFTITSLSPDEIPDIVERFVAALEKDPTMSQALTMAFATIQPESRRQRDNKFQELITDAAPGIDPLFARQAAAIICHLYSTLTWSTLSKRFGLNQEAITAALIWSMQTLLQDLTRLANSERTHSAND
jgi:AcrR family transcriptional regulator